MRIGIVGLGLIGGSLGAAFRAAGHQVIGSDRDPTAAGIAANRDLVDATASTAEVASNAEVIFICLPIPETLSTIPAVAGLMDRAAVLTDVASVKRSVLGVMEAQAAAARCVGGHPLAGRERSGPDAADPDLFRDAPYAVVPGERTQRGAVEVVEHLVADLGARSLEIEADAHDAMVARTSHLPQLLSSALSGALDGGRHDPLRGPGLAGMLRLAASDDGLWTEILLQNADHVSGALRGIIQILEEAAGSLDRRDFDAVQSLLRRGRQAVT